MTNKLNKIILRFSIMPMILLFTFAGGSWSIVPAKSASSASMEQGDAEDLQTVSDQSITSILKEILDEDEGISIKNMAIQTHDGIVTLDGAVENILARDRAVAMSETLKGVRAVVNRLSVKSKKDYSDERILQNVNAALSSDPVTHPYSFMIEVHDGSVAVKGEVPSWQLRDLATQMVKGVKGVEEVHNHISIEPKLPASDEQIAEEIAQRLASDVWIDDTHLTVEVQDQEVVLKGKVRSAAEKTRAVSHAWSQGIQNVNDKELQVQWETRDPVKQHPDLLNIPDQELEKAVKKAWLFDPRVPSFDPQVEVQDGVATLKGEVDNIRAKNAAEEDARNTVGIFDVRNYITIRSMATVDETEIAQKIREAIKRDPYAERFGVQVSVFDGTAYLAGTVETEYQKNRIERVASRFKGIADILNRIQVNPPPNNTTKQEDRELAQDIQTRLFWNPFVDSHKISIFVEDGVVTLKGTVDTWVESIEAEHYAQQAGAREVRNNLQLRQSSDFSKNAFPDNDTSDSASARGVQAAGT
jgi:osmotically-inducible protein OsmY